MKASYSTAGLKFVYTFVKHNTCIFGILSQHCFYSQYEGHLIRIFLLFFFQVKQNHAKSVFLACTAAIKNDVHIALYILPYVLTQVLQDGSQHDNKEVIYFC